MTWVYDVLYSDLLWEALVSLIALLAWMAAGLTWLIKYRTTQPDYVPTEDEEFVEWWQRLGSRAPAKREDGPEY